MTLGAIGLEGEFRGRFDRRPARIVDRFAGARNTQTMTQVRVDIQSAATATDILSNSDLDRAPGPGAVGIWAISDQTDSRMTVRIGSRQVASDITLPTGSLIDTEQVPMAMQGVRGGEKIVIDVVEVTAMALHTTVVWIGNAA